MALKIYNSLSKQKEIFTPLNPPFVGMYVCGPTVYGHSHLGHARSYVVFDVIYRYLKYLGYKIRYVQNITDVGHLLGNADAGNDKIQEQAKIEKIEPAEVAYNYEVSYFEDMKKLNILKPSISCRASGHIIDMIEFIKILINKKHAYVTDEGNVYFNVKSFPEYGKLSGRKVDEAKEGERIQIAKDKKDPADFALWKKADANHLMKWPSPWSEGYPGWHIECSVMSMKYIGETLDIHGGGLDNMFPHHECEIAQSEAVTNKPFVKYFIHHNLLTVNNTKMGKSLNNFIILKDLFKKINPIVLRFYILQSHYRSPLDFSEESLKAAETGINRLKNSYFALANSVKSIEKSTPFNQANEIKNKFIASMDDDFNTPQAIASLYELFKLSNNELNEKNMDNGKLKYLFEIVSDLAVNILGFKFNQKSTSSNREDLLIEHLLQIRNQFRQNKDFVSSDKIREVLLNTGITIKDSQNKTTFTKK